LKLEQELESRTKNRVVVKSSIEVAHPNIAFANRNINLFNDNVMQHFRKLKEKWTQTNDMRQVSRQRKIKWW
jgi:hypothetical protein